MAGALEVFLFLIGIYVVPWIIWVTFRRIAKFILHVKYTNRLKRLALKVQSIDLSVTEAEQERLTILAASTFLRINEKYKASISDKFSSKFSSIESFVKADANIQYAKQYGVKPKKRPFRKRYYR